MALHALRGRSEHEVAGLVTTFALDPERVGVHEVAADLIRRQADALGLPLVEIPVPAGAANAEYEAALSAGLAESLDRGVSQIAFGDLFLADVRGYRDALAARLGVRALYPVWGEATADFAHSVIASGFKAVVCSVDLSCLELAFAGRDFDEAFLGDLPSGVDPCGENGEFHTYVYSGPGFTRPVPLLKGTPERRGWLGCCPLSAAERPARPHQASSVRSRTVNLQRRPSRSSHQRRT